MKHCGVNTHSCVTWMRIFPSETKGVLSSVREETANEVITLVLPEELMHTERAKNTVSTNMHSVNNKDVCNTYGINRLWNLITMNYKINPMYTTVQNGVSFSKSLMLTKAAFIWLKYSTLYFYKILLQFKITVFKCNLLLWCTAEFSASLLQSSVSQNPSEIILIYWFWCSRNIIIINNVLYIFKTVRAWLVLLWNIFWRLIIKNNNLLIPNFWTVVYSPFLLHLFQ